MPKIGGTGPGLKLGARNSMQVSHELLTAASQGGSYWQGSWSQEPAARARQ